MIFKKKKEGTELEAEIVLWNGDVCTTTIFCQNNNADRNTIGKTAIRDGLFIESENRIVRVNEIRWKEEVVN